jgi:helix-turn-helix protein
MPRRAKVFGPAPGVPLDRNAKARIIVFVKAYNARMKQEGQHTGPITRAFMDVLRALLYAFHNSKDGRCFPSYERIAARANCCRATVYEAIRALETAGVLSWVHRLTKIRVPERDLFGQLVSRWQVIRTSNAYRFHDPQSGVLGAVGCESKNPSRPRIQESLSFMSQPTPSQTNVLCADDALNSVLISLAKTLGIDLKTTV